MDFEFILSSEQGRTWCVIVWRRSEQTRFTDMIEDGDLGYIVVGEETCPRTGKDHWHIYLKFPRKVTMGRVKSILRNREAHIEKRMGDQKSAIEYIKKRWNLVGIRNSDATR